MKRLIYTLCMLSVAGPMALLRCNGGGTIETTNGIVGCVINNDNSPAHEAVVKLFPSGYNPMTDGELSDEFIDTTDEKGNYRFYRITTGTYAVLARNMEAATSFITKGIAVDEDSVTTIPTGTLNRSGLITASFSAGETATQGYVYIPGTDIVASISNDGSVVLSDVPAGTVSEVILVSGTDAQRNVLRGDLTVTADDTATIDMPLMKYHRQLILNTSASGAGTTSDIPNFAVLVRLDSSNFDFSQTRADGKDVAFTGRHGRALSCEIERWAPESRHAELWVKVDTIFGNNATQYISMFWGAPEITGAPAAGAVFDSAAGYLGVWHLNGNASDASSSRNDATVCTPADAAGMVGIAKRFNGKDSIKIPTLLGKPQIVTLSAWARLDTIASGGKGAEIVSIGDGCLLRMDDDEDNFGASGSYHLTGENGFYHVYTGQNLRATGWHHLAIVFDCVSHLQTLYLDGFISAKSAGVDTISYNGMGANTFIGIHGNGKTVYNFSGIIDEVRIRKTALSEDAARLEYMNQKSKDALVVFGK